MSTKYIPYEIKLTKLQQTAMVKAMKASTGVNLRLKASQIGTGDLLPLTSRQITYLKKRKTKGSGAVLRMSKSQIQHMRSKLKAGGFLPLLASALAGPAISIGAPIIGDAVNSIWKGIKSIFGGEIEGSGYIEPPPQYATKPKTQITNGKGIHPFGAGISPFGGCVQCQSGGCASCESGYLSYEDLKEDVRKKCGRGMKKKCGRGLKKKSPKRK